MLQVIYDLLVKSSAQLELREDPELGVTVAGLRHIHVQSAEDIMVRVKGLIACAYAYDSYCKKGWHAWACRRMLDVC